MKKLKQILESALEDKAHSYKAISARDKKIAELTLSSLINIEKYYANKYENLDSKMIKHHYNATNLFYPNKERLEKSKKINKDIFNYQMSKIMQYKITSTVNKYITFNKNKVFSYLSFDKMPEEKVQKLENINAFFEKHSISDEKQVENDVQEL